MIPKQPLLVAVANDYDVVVSGVAAMLGPFFHRVSVLEHDLRAPASEVVDVLLYDTFGQRRQLEAVVAAAELVDVIERVHAGETVVATGRSVVRDEAAGDWPGRDFGLSPREGEIIAWIAQGLSNQDLADRAFLSVNTVKTYIRTAYRKMGVTNRAQAVIWALDRDFGIDPERERRQGREDENERW